MPIWKGLINYEVHIFKGSQSHINAISIKSVLSNICKHHLQKMLSSMIKVCFLNA